MAQKQKTELFLLLSNLFLVVCTVIVLTAALFIYQNRIQNLTLNENRFLTTEWHLLQELKAQTDRQLHEKDLEISRLRTEYQKLQELELSSDRLREIEAELNKAEEERAVILSTRLAVTGSPTAAGSDKPDALPINADTALAAVEFPESKAASTALTELLGERIKLLENQLEEYRLNAETAGLSVPVVPNVTDPVSGTAVQPDLQRILEQRLVELDREPAADIEAIRTRSLLRALVSSPSVRSEYPSLLDSLDKSYADFGRQEWLKGQKEAYRFVLQALKTPESVE